MQYTTIATYLMSVVAVATATPIAADPELPPPNPYIGTISEYQFDKCSWFPSGSHVSLKSDIGRCQTFNNADVRSIRYYIEPKGCRILMYNDKDCEDQTFKFEPIRGQEGDEDCVALPLYIWNSYKVVNCEV